MGPIILLPLAALAAVVGLSARQDDAPAAPPPVVQAAVAPAANAPAEITLEGFKASYQCGLYNHLRQVDSWPDARGNRFVILGVDDAQKYDQVWLEKDHKTVYFEVSSLFYKNKKGEPREYWPQPAQDEIAKAGFNLASGESENYNMTLRQPDIRQLWDVAATMLDVAYNAFGARDQDLRLAVGPVRDIPLSRNEACAYPH